MRVHRIQYAKINNIKTELNWILELLRETDLNIIQPVKSKAGAYIETIPATAGFPLPIDDYHKEVQRLAHKYGALYIADEVQTGLMRSGQMWCSVKYGASPDIIVTGS